MTDAGAALSDHAGVAVSGHAGVHLSEHCCKSNTYKARTATLLGFRPLCNLTSHGSYSHTCRGGSCQSLHPSGWPSCISIFQFSKLALLWDIYRIQGQRTPVCKTSRPWNVYQSRRWHGMRALALSFSSITLICFPFKAHNSSLGRVSSAMFLSEARVEASKGICGVWKLCWEKYLFFSREN